jgi:hypothetical protein
VPFHWLATTTCLRVVFAFSIRLEGVSWNEDERREGGTCLTLAIFAVTNADQSWLGVCSIGQLTAKTFARHFHGSLPYVF